MTPESHTHAELHHTGHRWLDISVAACAIVVSVTSLVVAIMHGRTMERMAEANARLVSANSWPLLRGRSRGLVLPAKVEYRTPSPSRHPRYCAG
jgi:hypothetical protein